MIDDDSDLRSRFESLKAEDARAVRPFSPYRETARQAAGQRRSPKIGAIAALALLLIAAITVQIRSTHKPPLVQISEWRSPTASLLNTPGDQLFIAMPRIEEPLIPRFKEQRN